ATHGNLPGSPDLLLALERIGAAAQCSSSQYLCRTAAIARDKIGELSPASGWQSGSRTLEWLSYLIVCVLRQNGLAPGSRGELAHVHGSLAGLVMTRCHDGQARVTGPQRDVSIDCRRLLEEGVGALGGERRYRGFAGLERLAGQFRR